jgi:hypothetical protein
MNEDDEVGLGASKTHLLLAFAIIGTAITLYAISVCAFALWWANALGG